MARSGGNRDGKHLEALGDYCPSPGHDGNLQLRLDFTRAKYWLAQGAEPTGTVAQLLRRVGLVPDAARPERLHLAPVGPTHRDAGGGLGGVGGRDGQGVPLLLKQDPADRAARVWELVRQEGTYGQQQRRRDAEARVRRGALDGRVAGGASPPGRG